METLLGKPKFHYNRCLVVLLGLLGALEGMAVIVLVDLGSPYILLLLAIPMGLLILLFLDRPLALLVLVFLSLPLFQREVNIGLYWLSPVDLTLYLYILAILLKGLMLSKSDFPSIPFGGHLGIAALLFIPSFLNTPNYWLSFKDWIRYLLAAAAYLSIYCGLMATPKRARWANMLIYLLAGGGCASAIAYLVDFIRRGHWGVSSIIAIYQNRPTGLFIDPNYFAEFLITIVPLTTSLLLVASSPALRVAAGATVALSVLAIVLTFSRSALLVLAGVGAILFFLLLRSEGEQRAKGLAIGAACLLVFLAIVLIWANPARPSLLLERIATLGTWQEYSLKSRWLILRTAANMIRSHPFIGVGLGAFEKVFDNYRPKGFFQSRQAAHNTFARLWAETGILGFGAIALLTLRIIRYLIHRFSTAQDKYWRRVLAGLFAGWLGSLLMSLTLDQFQLVYFWIYLGLTVAVAEIARGEPSGANYPSP